MFLKVLYNCEGEMVKLLPILFIWQYEKLSLEFFCLFLFSFLHCQKISPEEICSGIKSPLFIISMKSSFTECEKGNFKFCVNYVYLARLYLFFSPLVVCPMSLYDALRGLALSLWCSAWLIVFPVVGHFAGSRGYVLENHTNRIWRHWCAFSSKSLALGGFI